MFIDLEEAKRAGFAAACWLLVIGLVFYGLWINAGVFGR